VKIEDIEVKTFYAIREDHPTPYCGQVVAKDPDGGPWVKVIGRSAQGKGHWIFTANILMTWVDYTAKEAEAQRARELTRATQQEMENSIRESLHTLSIDTFVDIEVDDSTEAVQIIVDHDDLAAFVAELARAARAALPAHAQEEV
jgi:hypothetical protein